MCLFYLLLKDVGQETFVVQTCVFKDKAEELINAAQVADRYVHWDENNSGKAPKPDPNQENPWVDPRPCRVRRAAGFKMEQDEFYVPWKAQSSIDNSPETTSISGIVSFTNGQTGIVGTGTAFLTELQKCGFVLLDSDGEPYQVADVTDDEHATLTENFQGTDGSGPTSVMMCEKAKVMCVRRTIKQMYPKPSTPCTLNVDTFSAVGHGKADGDYVEFHADTFPYGLLNTKKYYVVNTTNDTFQIADTAGGAPLSFPTNGVNVYFE